MEELKDSHKYQTWIKALHAHEIRIEKVHELHTVRKSSGQVLFSMIRMDATSPEGNPLLPIAVIRGHFVSILTCLIDQDTGDQFLLLVCQRRVANGAEFYEMPAGMTDSEADPYVVALQELREETGLELKREDLHLLNPDMLYSSPGLTDEGGWFFFTELRLSREEIMRYHNKAMGAAGEHEFIRTHIATFPEARQLVKNINGLVNIYLYEMHLQSQS